MRTNAGTTVATYAVLSLAGAISLVLPENVAAIHDDAVATAQATPAPATTTEVSAPERADADPPDRSPASAPAGR